MEVSAEYDVYPIDLTYNFVYCMGRSILMRIPI